MISSNFLCPSLKAALVLHGDVCRKQMHFFNYCPLLVLHHQGEYLLVNVFWMHQWVDDRGFPLI
jgi:hypothetical protein